MQISIRQFWWLSGNINKPGWLSISSLILDAQLYLKLSDFNYIDCHFISVCIPGYLFEYLGTSHYSKKFSSFPPLFSWKYWGRRLVDKRRMHCLNICHSVMSVWETVWLWQRCVGRWVWSPRWSLMSLPVCRRGALACAGPYWWRWLFRPHLDPWGWVQRRGTTDNAKAAGEDHIQTWEQNVLPTSGKASYCTV